MSESIQVLGSIPREGIAEFDSIKVSGTLTFAYLMELQMSVLNRVSKDELFQRIKGNKHLSIRALWAIFGVHKDNEQDRPRLISIRQQLVELERAGYTTLHGSGDSLVAEYRQG